MLMQGKIVSALNASHFLFVGLVAVVALPVALIAQGPSTDSSITTEEKESAFEAVKELVVHTEQNDAGTTNEKPAAEVRQLKSFSEIEVSGRVDVTIHRGTKQHVEIKGEAALISRLETKVIRRERKNRLVIKFADNKPLNSNRVTVNITVPKLDAVTAGETAIVAMHELKQQSLKVLLKDAAKFHATGVSDQLSITLENSSRADVSSLSVNSMIVLAKGHSSLSLGNPSSLMVTANDKSKVIYKSTPAQLLVNSNGASQVKRREITKGVQQ